MNDDSILLDTQPSLIVSVPTSRSYEIRYRYQGDPGSILSSYYNFERELSVDSPLLLVRKYIIHYNI